MTASLHIYKGGNEMIKSIEGNTSTTQGLIANGGGVFQKEYADSYNRIAAIYRPKYIDDEAMKVAAEAKKYIGYLEKKSNSQLENFSANAGYNNYNMFAPHAKKATGCSVYQNGVAWCDIFVDDVFIRALGTTRALELLGGWSAYTPTSASYLKKIGALNVAPFNARYGDIIFFKNSSRICHTGIVMNDYYEKPADYNNFTYTQQEFVSDVCKTLKVSNATKALAKTVTLSEKKNSKHILVLLVQKRLKHMGYYTGTPDREFGPMTTTAVNKYQKSVLGYKTPDGEITKKGRMWKTLLGL